MQTTDIKEKREGDLIIYQWVNEKEKTKYKETLEEQVACVVKEEVTVVRYDPRWQKMFESERLHLMSCLPADLVNRIEHFGSTALRILRLPWNTATSK